MRKIIDYKIEKGIKIPSKGLASIIKRMEIDDSIVFESLNRALYARSVGKKIGIGLIQRKMYEPESDKCVYRAWRIS